MELEGTLMRFPIVVHKDEGSSYGVAVPDLPGCFSGGDTLDDAFLAVQEAILLHLEGMLAGGDPLPQTKPIQVHISNADYGEGIWGFVDVDLADIPGDKTVRVNITVPSRVLATIDKQAKQDGETRSGFLAKAALEHIATRALG